MFTLWEELERAEGRHMVLTARNGAAVEAWLEHWRVSLAIGHLVGKIERVISTSDPLTKDIPAAVKKSLVVEDILAGKFEGFRVSAADIVMYDDHRENLEEIRLRTPGVNLRIVRGRDSSPHLPHLSRKKGKAKKRVRKKVGPFFM